MELEYNPPRRPFKNKKSPIKWVVVACMTLLVTVGILIFLYYFDNQPSMETIHPYPEVKVLEENGSLYPVLLQGEVLKKEGIIVHEQEFYIPLALFKREIDPTIAYDEESKSIIYTSPDQVVILNNSVLKNEIKGEQVELQFPVTEIEGTMYVPFSPFENMYPFTLRKYDVGVVELEAYNQPVLYAEVDYKTENNVPVYIRSKRSEQSPYVQSVPDGMELVIYNEEQDWYHVRTKDGVAGYIPKEKTKINGIRTEQWEKEEKEFVPWNPIGGKINLTWEHVFSRTPDPSKIDAPVGVNVVAPTWFHLKDETGQLTNTADKRYVDWAHKQGYQVWALVTNNFNPDLTHSVLSSYEKRRNVILQLIHFAEIYQLDGINIDFENVYLKDKENLVQFVRELTPYLHELDLVVSIDVTIKSQSELWSLFLDRQSLGQIVDYMMVMTYDEHWATSPIAGSVASLPWVEKGLQGILEDVPKEKVLLGVPFYTRLWKEEMIDGEKKVTSKAYSMEAIEKWIKEKKVTLSYDSASGQDYGEYVDTAEGATYKVWLENEKSMAKRVDLIHKYNLAGLASWRRGFEQPSIWETIKNSLNKPLK